MASCQYCGYDVKKYDPFRMRMNGKRYHKQCAEIVVKREKFIEELIKKENE